jgi:hypothetical protein
MAIKFAFGKYGEDFAYEEHTISVFLSAEFIKRVTSRKPKPNLETLKWLLDEGVKDPLDYFIGQQGTLSIEATLRTAKSKINVPLIIERRRGDPSKIKITVKTIYVGEFIPYETDDYVRTFEHLNPPMRIVFERDYDPALMDAVMDDLRTRAIKAHTGYHFMDEFISYIAEVEPDEILIPDARWRRAMHVFEFAA